MSMRALVPTQARQANSKTLLWLSMLENKRALDREPFLFAFLRPVCFVVPRVGIEPTLLAEPDFESGASTNFTTEAMSKNGRLRELHADTPLVPRWPG